MQQFQLGSIEFVRKPSSGPMLLGVKSNSSTNVFDEKQKGTVSPTKPKRLGVGTAVALFAFEAENADELNFKKGDEITILTIDETIGGEGWWVGLLGTDQGVFPKEYVKYTPYPQ